METTIPVKVQPLSPDAFRPWAGAGKSSAPLSRGRGRAVLRGDAPTETAPQTSGTTSCWAFLRDCRGWNDHGRHPRDSAPAYKERQVPSVSFPSPSSLSLEYAVRAAYSH